ncbi:MAG: hypothetical protein RBS73_18095 [Prolixibacteraceae bacterium]|jgi:hypothetical protein|nr:hypothetical protein [Prolixibacteraceae bacterium]
MNTNEKTMRTVKLERKYLPVHALYSSGKLAVNQTLRLMSGNGQQEMPWQLSGCLNFYL